MEEWNADGQDLDAPHLQRSSGRPVWSAGVKVNAYVKTSTGIGNVVNTMIVTYVANTQEAFIYERT